MRAFLRNIGIFIGVLGLLGLLLFVMESGFFRFSHPNWTQTQLMGRAMDRWVYWSGSIAAIILGYVLVVKNLEEED